MEHNNFTNKRLLGTMIRNQWLFLAASVWVASWAITHAWPASWWFEVTRFSVLDSVQGEIVPIDVERVIHRPFDGTWTVLVRRWEEKGWVVECAAHGGGEYETDALLPAPLTLKWWTNGECSGAELKPGRYMLITKWIIHGGFLPDKSVKVESNIFEVTA